MLALFLKACSALAFIFIHLNAGPEYFEELYDTGNHKLQLSETAKFNWLDTANLLI
jgi:hypothetical protein